MGSLDSNNVLETHSSLSLALALAVSLTSAQTYECIAADQSSCECVFPFKYNGVTYNTCTRDGEDKEWCATGPNADGEYVGDSRFGWCYGGFLQALSLDV